MSEWGKPEIEDETPQPPKRSGNWFNHNFLTLILVLICGVLFAWNIQPETWHKTLSQLQNQTLFLAFLFLVIKFTNGWDKDDFKEMFKDRMATAVFFGLLAYALSNIWSNHF